MIEELDTDVGFDPRIDIIETALDREDFAAALRLAVSALQDGVRDALVLALAAEHFEKAGDTEQALSLLNEATQREPGEAELWRRLGTVLARLGRFDEALRALDVSLGLEPDSYPTLVIAGLASFRSGELVSANKYYRRAAELMPGERELWATLAVIAARLNDISDARAFAARVLSEDPGSINANTALARCDVHEGHAELAKDRLSLLLAQQGLGNEARANILDLRAEANDSLERMPEAFADYIARNELLRSIYAPVRKGVETRIGQVRRLNAYFSAIAGDSATEWDKRCGTTASRVARSHVFLVGFPRSGTTLIEKALASHPDFVTLEEVDIIGEVGSQFLNSNEGLIRLARLSPDETEACRRDYWQSVQTNLGQDLSGKVVLDKLPLHTLALPVIARLFPDAKILFAVRDPRDVVFSCFRRRFRMNSAMFEFLTLDGAAHYYDEVMKLAVTYRRLLQLDLREIRYENVVRRFDDELAGVLEFAGAKWDDAVRNFAERARARTRTPSDLQIQRGLNSEGMGQWCRYRNQLSPVLALLEPWVREFGYESDSLV